MNSSRKRREGYLNIERKGIHYYDPLYSFTKEDFIEFKKEAETLKIKRDSRHSRGMLLSG